MQPRERSNVPLKAISGLLVPEYPSRGDLRLRCTSTDSIKVINDNSYRQTTVSDIERI